jgi:hypothetical protein
MIHPVASYSIAGAIWYQGKTNIQGHRHYYGLGLQTMINGWHSNFGKELINVLRIAVEHVVSRFS